MRSPLRTAAERPARRRLGRDMQHDRAEGGAAHARVGDAHHVLDARRAPALRGSADSRPRACRDGACGPAFCSTRKSSGVTSRSGSSMRAARSSSDVEHHRAAFVLEQASVGGRALEDRAVRRQRCRTARPARRPAAAARRTAAPRRGRPRPGRRRRAARPGSRPSTVRQSRCSSGFSSRSTAPMPPAAKRSSM